MDGTGKHFAKWNKPGSERQIPYDLTYKWNLINKTNKWAKKTRDMKTNKQKKNHSSGWYSSVDWVQAVNQRVAGLIPS